MLNKQFIISLLLLFSFGINTYTKPLETSLSVDTTTDLNPTTAYYIKVNINATEIYKKNVFENTVTVGILMKSYVYVGCKLSVFNDFKGLYLNNVSKTGGAYMNGGFLGLIVEPFLPQKSAFNVTFPITFAAGMVSFSNVKNIFNTSKSNFVDRALYLLIQPGIEFQWNFLKNYGLGVGASYRHTSGLSVGDLPYDLLDGLNFGMSIRVML
jgi:hypothetical protein